MALFPIYVLVVYGVPIVILGLITLASVPEWRITRANLLVFVLGGFVGMFMLFYLVALILLPLESHWKINWPGGVVISYVALAAGAELGGIASVYLKARWSKSAT